MLPNVLRPVASIDGTPRAEAGHDLKMRFSLHRWLRLAALALASGASAVALAALPVVPGEPSRTPKDAAVAPVLRMSGARAPRVALPLLEESELRSVREANQRTPLKRLAIGVARSIPTQALAAATRLQWVPVDGGYAARIEVNSPQAGALRLAVDLAGVPGDVEMVAFGSDDPARLEGPVRVADIPDRTAPWWSPITDGETQTIEFFVPRGIDPASLRLKVTAASHLFTNLASGLAKRVSEIGLSASCEVDVKCSSLAASKNHKVLRVDATTCICAGVLSGVLSLSKQ